MEAKEAKHSIGNATKRPWGRVLKPRQSSGVVGLKTIELNYSEDESVAILDAIKSSATSRGQMRADVFRALTGQEVQRNEKAPAAVADASMPSDEAMNEAITRAYAKGKTDTEIAATMRKLGFGAVVEKFLPSMKPAQPLSFI